MIVLSRGTSGGGADMRIGIVENQIVENQIVENQIVENQEALA
jgi:hypothetical protein